MYNRITGRKRWLLGATALFLCAVLVTGCNSGESFDITGSNTVQPLSVVWAEEFMANNDDVSIAVSGAGSGVGIAALIDGTTDIAQSSRSIKQSEIDAAVAKGVDPNEIMVAKDALAVVVHPSNSVTELTFAEISAMYTGEITNWQELGGPDLDIVAVARDTNSGTHVFFKEAVVQMRGLPTEDTSLEYGGDVLFLPSTSAGITEVAGNPSAIFYSGLAYVDETVQTVAVSQTGEDPYVLPSVEAATDGTYRVWRLLFYYTDGEPIGIVATFIEYCLSPAGQAKVLEVGYVPLG